MFDMSRAFDKIWHDCLSHKLDEPSLNEELWFYISFVTHRN